MSKKRIYLYTGLLIVVVLVWLIYQPNNKNENFSETVKISLRDVGNKLLLTNNDSTSLILPVVELSKSKYKLAFNKELALEPRSFVSYVQQSFEKASLPDDYQVEVINCNDKEVAYSYKISAKKESTIIPCFGRVLPKDCYLIKVYFSKIKATTFFSKKHLLLIIALLILIALLDYSFSKRKQVKPTEVANEGLRIGSFKFYPQQNKLVKATAEINLSKKECEILAIFVANPNQIIKRDELTKKVWEDNGVFVGRSLDTYISKLRKKLKEDDSIKLTNTHGVGYKLEVKS